MKYPKQFYLDAGFYPGDDEIESHKEQIVKCRKPHICGGCGAEIEPGYYALCEKGFCDGHPVSAYTCIPCIENWLEESGQIEEPENKGTGNSRE